MNFTIQLHTNDQTDRHSLKMSLHEEAVELLEFDLKSYGGFKRFELDILDETEEGSNVIGVNNWLNDNVFTGEDKKAFYKELWELLGNVFINDDGEIQESFLDFEIGTDREDIWHWFEDTFNISVGEEFFNII